MLTTKLDKISILQYKIIMLHNAAVVLPTSIEQCYRRAGAIKIQIKLNF